MDGELMERQDLGELGLAVATAAPVKRTTTDDEGKKEAGGFVAGKHIKERRKGGWFFL